MKRALVTGVIGQYGAGLSQNSCSRKDIRSNREMPNSSALEARD